MSATVSVTAPRVVRLLDHAVGDLDRRRQVEDGVGRDEALLERAGDRERLEGRARLVGEAGRPVRAASSGVGDAGRWGRRAASSRAPGPRRPRVHDDRGRALRLVGLADVGEHLLGARLELGVDRQPQVLALLGPAERVALDLVAERVADHLALAVGAAEQLLVGRLEPGEALVVDPDGADHVERRARPPDRPAGSRQRGDAGELRACAPGRRSAGRPCGPGRRTRGPIGERAKDLLLGDVEQGRQAAGGPRRVLDLVGSRDDVRRVLGDGELPAVAVEDPPRRPGMVTVWVCWLWASAASPPPCTPCTQAARPIAITNRSRKQANRRPTRCSIIVRRPCRARRLATARASRSRRCHSPAAIGRSRGYSRRRRPAAGCGLVASVVAVVASVEGAASVGCATAAGHRARRRPASRQRTGVSGATNEAWVVSSPEASRFAAAAASSSRAGADI